jgi:hypothetical protein
MPAVPTYPFNVTEVPLDLSTAARGPIKYHYSGEGFPLDGYYIYDPDTQQWHGALFVHRWWHLVLLRDLRHRIRRALVAILYETGVPTPETLATLKQEN